jgi:hypothetical protein
MNSRHGLRLATAATCLMAAAGLWSAVHAWTAPERVDRRPDGYRTFLSDIAVGSDGTPHVVWTEYPTGTYYEKTMYARRVQDTWSVPVNISRDSGDIRTPAIVVDDSGVALIVWSEQGQARMRYVRQMGDSWSAPKLTFTQSTAIPRLVIDVLNQIHLLFDGYNGIWYSRYESGADSWATPMLVASGPSGLSWQDVTADRQGHLHAVWMDYGTNGLGYSFYDGTRWSTPESLPDPAPGSYQSCDPKVAADADCKPHVVWQERAGGYFLYYTKRSADTWTTPYRFFDQSGGYPFIAADAADRLHVVWGWDYGIRYIVRVDSAWSSPASLTDTAAFFPRLAQGPSRLHLIWTQGTQIRYSEHDLSGISEEAPAVGARALIRACRTGNGYRLDFSLANSGDARLELADVAGRVARRIRLGYFNRGRHEVELSLDSVPNGVYFCRLHCGSEMSTLKLIVNQ